MKRFFYIVIVLVSVVLMVSCAPEDDFAPASIEKIYTDNPEVSLIVDIVFVTTSEKKKDINYKLNIGNYIDDLNGYYFNRYNINLEVGENRFLISDELFDLRDNRGEETAIFEKETDSDYKKDRITLYVMHRSNIYAKAGLSSSQRALITDEFLNSSTSPHEIGHILGLPHSHEEGNFMSMVYPDLRKEFNKEQVDIMTKQIKAKFAH